MGPNDKEQYKGEGERGMGVRGGYVQTTTTERYSTW